MKRGNLWMTVIGAGLVMATMTAGRAAMHSPTMLYLAGQFQVATGHTDEGIRLINEAASQRDSGTVHAAEPAARPTQVCTKTQPKTTQVKPARTGQPSMEAVSFAPSARKSAPVLMARLDVPTPPIPPAALDPTRASFDPMAFRYLNDQQRAEIIKAQVELEKAQVERTKHIRQNTQAIIEKYAPTAMGLNPVDLSTIEQQLPTVVGQMAH